MSSFDSMTRIPSSLRCFSSQSVSTSASGCAYSVGCVLDYQMIGVFKVSVPIDLLDAAGKPDFSAVRLDDGDRRLVAHNTSRRCSSLYPYLQVHPVRVHLRQYWQGTGCGLGAQGGEKGLGSLFHP